MVTKHLEQISVIYVTEWAFTKIKKQYFNWLYEPKIMIINLGLTVTYLTEARIYLHKYTAEGKEENINYTKIKFSSSNNFYVDPTFIYEPFSSS